MSCDLESATVERIEEEKRAAQREREELLANFEQHQQLEKQQQEEKRKVGPNCHVQLCSPCSRPSHHTVLIAYNTHVINAPTSSSTAFARSK